MGRSATLAELSVITGRSERTLIQDTNSGMPCQERGGDGQPSTYDTAEAITWLIARAAARVSATTEEERRRLIAAQATKAELDLKVRAGELVNARDFRAGAERAARELREALLAVPPRIAPVLAPDSPERVQALLQRELEQVLRGLAHYLEELKPPVPVQTSGHG
jgi:phage terminase Nu1 subunit (DNA packaging protein)